MSEKDIKTKPKQSPKSKGSPNMPKVAVKSKDAVVNTVKDAKAVMKDTLVKKAVESKLGTEQGYSEPQKADTEASERVEASPIYTHAGYFTTLPGLPSSVVSMSAKGANTILSTSF